MEDKHLGSRGRLLHAQGTSNIVPYLRIPYLCYTKHCLRSYNVKYKTRCYENRPWATVSAQDVTQANRRSIVVNGVSFSTFEVLGFSSKLATAASSHFS
jgi:hypothetical protein